MHASGKTFDTLTQADLKTLAEYETGQGQVFSLYLTLENQQPPVERFEAMLNEQARSKKLDQTGAGIQQDWNQQAENIRAWLRGHSPKNLALPLSQQPGHPVTEERTATDDPATRDDRHVLDYLAGRGELPETDNIDVRNEVPYQGEDSALDKRAAQDDLAARGKPAYDHSHEQERRADQLADRETLATPEEWVSPENWPSGRRGLVIFSGPGLWRAYLLPSPMPDLLHVDARPFVRPLELMQAEYPCTLAVMVDPGSARLVRVHMGQASELESMRTLPVTGADMDSSIEAYTRQAVDHAAAAWQMYPCDHLIIAGSRDARVAVNAALPQNLRERLVGEADLSPLVTLEAVRDRVLAIDEKREQRLEEQRLQEFLAEIETGGAAVAGLEQVLLAVRSKKVRLLLAEADFHQPGGACPNCGFLGEGQEGLCLVCEMAMRPEPDLVEAALKKVVDAGGEIDVLRSPKSRGRLEPHGRIGALLYDEAHQPTKDRSNQRTLSKGGQANPDALHDEAIDESFPASDPPSWTH